MVNFYINLNKGKFELLKPIRTYIQVYRMEITIMIINKKDLGLIVNNKSLNKIKPNRIVYPIEDTAESNKTLSRE